MKLTGLLATVGLLAATLSGCGSNSENGDKPNVPNIDAYCAVLSDAAEEHFADDEIADPEEAYRALVAAADKAPETVRADWKVVSGAVNGMFDALAEAGLTFDELFMLMAGGLPNAPELSKLTAVHASFDELRSPEFDAAQDVISKHAKSGCDVDLDLSSE